MERTQTASDLRLRLELPSEPDCVGLVRSVIGLFARAGDLAPGLVDDMRTAISEACNNVVMHAYPGSTGPLIFSIAVGGDTIEAIVRDHGCGIRPGSGRNRGLGMGVTLINSLADRAEFESSELGTEVRIRFKCPVSVRETLGRFSPGVWALTDPESSGALQARSN
jgi:anti-sigma regulatory factor (Ser/Thr protein kinase)